MGFLIWTHASVVTHPVSITETSMVSSGSGPHTRNIMMTPNSSHLIGSNQHNQMCITIVGNMRLMLILSASSSVFGTIIALHLVKSDMQLLQTTAGALFPVNKLSRQHRGFQHWVQPAQSNVYYRCGNQHNQICISVLGNMRLMLVISESSRELGSLISIHLVKSLMQLIKTTMGALLKI